MQFSYNAVWNDTVAMLRANRAIIAAVIGVFIFLPALLLAYLIPPAEAETLAEIVDQFLAQSHWYFLQEVVGMVGTIAILVLLLGPDRPTVGAALAKALALLPFYLLVSFCAGLIMLAGFMALLLPGLYAIGRLAAVGPVLVVEGERNPIAVIRRSFELTRERGWAILGLILLVGAAGLVIMAATMGVIGSILLLVAGKGLGGLLTKVLSSALSSALSAVFAVLTAAIYRSLAADRSVGARFQ